MKIFTTRQVKEIDNYTIINEPVSSADLMERAADQLLKWYVRNFDRSGRVLIFTGPGNNGGDGLALARLLSANRFDTEVFFVNTSGNTSDDWKHNFQRLEKETTVLFNTIESIEHFPLLNNDDVVIDAIFGSGLSRPVEGLAGLVINKLNQVENVIVSIDIPSGLYGEDNSLNKGGNIIQADFTLSFEFPKLAFMFAENAGFTGEWQILPIGLSPVAIRNTQTPYIILEKDYVFSLLKKRGKFDHKGKFGHGLLVAGSYGKMGASVLGARAALKTGIGLVSCHIPGSGYQIIQTALPEAMAQVDKNELHITDIGTVDKFDAVGIGPGTGTDPDTQKALHSILTDGIKPLVLDADAINILGLNKEWLSELPPETILTPHIREFERLVGKCDNSFIRMKKLTEFAVKHNCIVVLKGAHTSIASPDGKIVFNSTGNPGMATAGSGDVLTGMILSLLAQDYSPVNAAVTGVYLHGLAGDIAGSKSCYESIIATDIIDNIGNAFIRI
ncbi:MAG TPA: bifunctional ADP-dependent NAD(P)H-hydrate dehydratase/NAD(P)H-hydrate epimerase, partial [Bacteroidales bacterium]|nr:bifunctional ADP-dependent NAD(P)H-hydrate dehydratase/NAD(P)H-hydrate epimerase [Bacteroidales bacterium]